MAAAIATNTMNTSMAAPATLLLLQRDAYLFSDRLIFWLT
jgi:hypothetical protein